MGRAGEAAAKLRVFPVIGGRAAVAQPIHVDALCDALLELARRWPTRRGSSSSPTPRCARSATSCSARPGSASASRPTRSTSRSASPAPRVRVATRLRLPTPDQRGEPRRHRRVRADGHRRRHGPARHRSPTARRRRGRSADGPAGRAAAADPRRRGPHRARARAHRRAPPAHGARRASSTSTRPRSAGVTSFAGPTIPAFTDLDEALREVRPDAAIIGTPPSSHVPLARKLLAAGVDVLVEKPVAASDEDRVALADAVRRAPRPLPRHRLPLRPAPPPRRDRARPAQGPLRHAAALRRARVRLPGRGRRGRAARACGSSTRASAAAARS